MLFFTALLLSAPPVTSHTLGDGAVTFETPKEWTIQGRGRKRGSEALVFALPSNTNMANAVVTVGKNDGKTTLDSHMKKMLPEGDPKFIVVTKTIDDENWATALSRAQAPPDVHLVIDRFGATKKTIVHFRVAFPLPAKPQAGWMKKTIDEVNALFASLKIGGKSTIGSQLVRRVRDKAETVALERKGATSSSKHR